MNDSQSNANMFMKELSRIMKKHNASFSVEVTRNYSESWGDLTFDINGESSGNEISLDVHDFKDIHFSDIDALVTLDKTTHN